MDDESEDKKHIELCDTLDTLPDIDVETKKQTETSEKTNTEFEREVKETGFFEGDPVLFFPITNSTRRNIAPLFGLYDVQKIMSQMPDYKLGGTGQGLKPPKKVYVIKADGNCYFRSVSFILTGEEKYHGIVRETICDFIAVHYHDLNLFLDEYKDGEHYLRETGMRNDTVWGTELEIIATATIAKRDVIVFNHTGYLRYKSPFGEGHSVECFFIDNRAGGHFNVILQM